MFSQMKITMGVMSRTVVTLSRKALTKAVTNAKIAMTRYGLPFAALALFMPIYSKRPVGFITLMMIIIDMRSMITFQSTPNSSE